MILIPLLLGFSIVFGLVGRWLWPRLRGWPVPLRILLITSIVTPIITPSLLAGEGGGIFVPVAVVLLDSIYNQSSREFFQFVFTPLLMVGSMVYFVASAVVFVCYLVSKAKSPPIA